MIENHSAPTGLLEEKKRRRPSLWMASLCNPHQATGLMGGNAGGESARLIEVVPRQGGSDRTLYLCVEPGYPVPGFAHGKGYGLILEGEVYNRSVLREWLGESSPKPCSDAELILNAYRRWGNSFLEKIEGVYIIILWDGNIQNLLCARDRVGIYPFFYATEDQRYFFSTSCTALAQHPSISKEINTLLLLEQFCKRWSYSEDTYYHSIRRLLPAHAINVTPLGPRAYRYWEPLKVESQINWVCEEELEEFNPLFEQAVSRCHLSGKTGIFLSGGLDSVSVATVLSDLSRRDGFPLPLALSIGVPDTQSEEAMIQKATAQELGLPQVMVPFEEAVGLEGWLESGLTLNRTWPWPLHNWWLPLLASLALDGKKQGCDAILTGFGGDEWLTSSPSHSVDLLQSMDLKGFYHFWRGVFRSYNIPRRHVLRSMVWKYNLYPLLIQWTKAGLEGMSPALLQSLRGYQANRSFPDWVTASSELRQRMVERREAYQEPVKGQSNYLRKLKATFRSFVAMTALEESFEMGRRLGLRICHPFWDVDLIKFLCRVPPKLLHKGDRSKALVRMMLKKRFPSLGLERQKKIEQDDLFTSLMRARGPLVWKNLGGAKKLADLGLVCGKRLEGKIHADIFKNKDKDIFWFWTLIKFESWLRTHA